MNTPEIKFPTHHDLSLRRSAPELTPSVDGRSAALAKAHCRLIQDLEELREREENLRAYENRLRAMQDEFESGRQAGALNIPSQQNSPLANTPGADEAWRKLHRARELLEVEQKHLVTERLVLRAERETVQKREDLPGRRLVLASRNPDWNRITFASCCSHELDVVSPAHHREET